MATIKLRNLQKTYKISKSKQVEAVKGIDLDIDEREFAVFVGPSGCGKTTTLRMIAGLESITSGEISINERLINDVEPKDRDIAMVFQNYALYPHMSVYDNIAFSLKNRKVKKEIIQEKVLSIAKILNLENKLTRKPQELSGGQRQRVAMGRAIIRNPKVFLMDEPLSNLDAKLRVQMRNELIKLHRELEATFIFVTHDQVEAMTLATKIVVMNKGNIMQVGTPEEIFNHPANIFVAEFIGSLQMNFFPGKLHIIDNKTIFDSHFVKFPLEANKLVSSLADNQDVVLGIRPEHLQIVKETDDYDILMQANIVENMGSYYNIYGDCLGKDIVIQTRKEMELHSGQSIKVRIMMDKIHLFDEESETSLMK